MTISCCIRLHIVFNYCFRIQIVANKLIMTLKDLYSIFYVIEKTLEEIYFQGLSVLP